MSIKKIARAKLYETTPMYYANQEKFINTVIRGVTDLSPRELLAFVKEVEKRVGRIKRFRNGPREIDIDILFYDDFVRKGKNFHIPHPRIQERKFVLEPFADIDPDFIHPVLKKTIRQLLKGLRKKR